ncbi:unnamed protein product [Vitrella brassicaformis CCMP3155]|uniref:Uncharacterized protein n=1 Tax=Vitrella brassicaformis (strain CCMP3155) TaxID=1169540 RepID=A0A0G4FED8_VITBC|nr:unnamed protein product [Vitrella brassicaformis CCMP3155]|eukprot:CEM11221.1 unnamed protein product [Vitrella brassicaformis CCMP3155]
MLGSDPSSVVRQRRREQDPRPSDALPTPNSPTDQRQEYPGSGRREALVYYSKAVVTALHCFLCGVLDALQVHRCVVFFVKSEIIRTRCLQCFIMNGLIFLGSILIFDHLILPLFYLMAHYTYSCLMGFSHLATAGPTHTALSVSISMIPLLSSFSLSSGDPSAIATSLQQASTNATLTDHLAQHLYKLQTNDTLGGGGGNASLAEQLAFNASTMPHGNNSTVDTREIVKAVGFWFGCLYRVLWIYPIYYLSFILNTLWYQDLADQAFIVCQKYPHLFPSQHNATDRGAIPDHGARKRKAAPSPSGPSPHPPSQSSPLDRSPVPHPSTPPAHSSRVRFLDRLVDEVFRVLLNMVWIMQTYVLWCIVPGYLGVVVYALQSSWLASMYCFEYRWVSVLKWSACERLEYFESHWLYFAGFGMPLTLLYVMSPRFIDSGVFALIFPVCILLSITATPRPFPYPPLQRLPIFYLVQLVTWGVLKYGMTEKRDGEGKADSVEADRCRQTHEGSAFHQLFPDPPPKRVVK